MGLTFYSRHVLISHQVIHITDYRTSESITSRESVSRRGNQDSCLIAESGMRMAIFETSPGLVYLWVVLIRIPGQTVRDLMQLVRRS